MYYRGLSSNRGLGALVVCRNTMSNNSDPCIGEAFVKPLAVPRKATAGDILGCATPTLALGALNPKP